MYKNMILNSYKLQEKSLYYYDIAHVEQSV
jgi:hypothetical protein